MLGDNMLMCKVLVGVIGVVIVVVVFIVGVVGVDFGVSIYVEYWLLIIVCKVVNLRLDLFVVILWFLFIL